MIVNDHIASLKVGLRKQEKKIVDFMDRDFIDRINLQISNWENPPEMYKSKGPATVKKMKGWKKQILLLHNSSGLKFSDRLKVLREDLGFKVQPTEALEEFATKWAAVPEKNDPVDPRRALYNYEEKLKLLRDYLMANGLNPFDLPTIYSAIQEIVADRSYDPRYNPHFDRFRTTILQSLLDNHEPMSYRDILLDHRSDLFEHFGVDFSIDEISGLRIDEAAWDSFEFDVQARDRIDDRLSVQEHDSDWKFEDSEKTIPADEIMKKIEATQAEAKRIDIDQLFVKQLNSMDSKLDFAIGTVANSNFPKEWKDDEIKKLIKKKKDVNDHRGMNDNVRNEIKWLKDNINEIETLDGKEERDKFLRSYEEAIDELNGELKNIDGFKRKFHEVEEGIDDYVLSVKNQDKAKDADIEVTWMSLHDFWRVGSIVKEWAQRRYERRSEKALGEVGSKVAGSLAYLDPTGKLITLPNEFDKRKESSEKQEVEQYKEAYNNKDAWQIQEILYNTWNQDEANACLALLSDLGRLRIDDPRLWKVLMRFQDQVYFNVDQPGQENVDPTKLLNKLQHAVGVVWDFDLFRTWNTTNDSNWDSQKNSFTPLCDQLGETEAGLGGRLESLLRDWKKKGDEAKVNPHEYERIIDYAIEQGKMAPEHRLYYVIQGVATGLLPMSRIRYYDAKWLNTLPAIQVFSSPTARGDKPTMLDIKEWAQYDADANTVGSAFRFWYHTYVSYIPNVRDRLDKTLTQGNNRMDHDDFASTAGYSGATTIEQALRNQSTGGYAYPITAYPSAAAGYNFALRTFAEAQIKNIEMGADKGDVMPELARLLNSFVRYDAITDNRMYRSQGSTFFRITEDLKRKPPRMNYGGIFNKTLTAGEYIDETRKIMEQLDSEIMPEIFKVNSETDKDDIAKLVQRIEDKFGTPKKSVFKSPPKNGDELLSQFDVVAARIIEQNTDAVTKLLKNLVSGHDEFREEMKNKPIAQRKDVYSPDEDKARIKELEATKFDNIYNYYYDSDSSYTGNKSQDASRGGNVVEVDFRTQRAQLEAEQKAA